MSAAPPALAAGLAPPVRPRGPVKFQRRRRFFFLGNDGSVQRLVKNALLKSLAGEIRLLNWSKIAYYRDHLLDQLSQFLINENRKYMKQMTVSHAPRREIFGNSIGQNDQMCVQMLTDWHKWQFFPAMNIFYVIYVINFCVAEKNLEF